MITRSQCQAAQGRAAELIRSAGIALSDDEVRSIEVVDFGLGHLEREPPGERHWFQARSEPVVMYSFSTVARDALDGFTDPDIERMTRIAED